MGCKGKHQVLNKASLKLQKKMHWIRPFQLLGMLPPPTLTQKMEDGQTNRYFLKIYICSFISSFYKLLKEIYLNFYVFLFFILLLLISKCIGGKKLYSNIYLQLFSISLKSRI